MGKAIVVYKYGGPEVMKWEDVALGEPKSGEIKVKNKGIGVNYLDVYMRQGVVRHNEPPFPSTPPLPFTPGMEAAGVIMEVGPGVTTCKVGDMVAYIGLPTGAYGEEQIIPADRAVPVPPSIDPVVAAGAIFKGLTAETLVRRCFQVKHGHTILYHAAAGGVGSLVCQWANALGATVIGTVSTKEKAAQAKEDGCHHVIIHTEENFVDRVMEITSGKGVDVVYDSIGKDTLKGSIKCLKVRGYLLSFGIPSGLPDPIEYFSISEKGLFFSCPALAFYTVTRNELLEASQELFSSIKNGILKVRVNHKYPLSQAVQAHSDLENRKTTGSIVLIPDN